MTHDRDLAERVAPEAADAALAEPHTRVFDVTGRPMKGWILVAGAGLESSNELNVWVGRGLGFARSLPPKR